jgi:chromosome partitioning protein
VSVSPQEWLDGSAWPESMAWLEVAAQDCETQDGAAQDGAAQHRARYGHVTPDLVAPQQPERAHEAPDHATPALVTPDQVPPAVVAASRLAVSRETASQDGAPTRSRARHARTGASQSTTESGVRQVSCPPKTPPGVAGVISGEHGGGMPSNVGWTPIAEEAERATRVKHPTDRLPRPARRRVLAVANQKGGVGKTTSTVNLAAGLALQGLRTLVVDLDPQGNASTALGIEHRAGTRSVYEVLLGEIGLADAVAVSPQSSNLLCIPATIDLAGAEIELVSMVARESRLLRALSEVTLDELGVDYVFIDCPPSLGLLTVNALVAAPEVLIPIQCEYYALEGLGQLLRNIELVQAHLNPALRVSTILLTMYDGRTKLADQVAAEVREHFGDQVLRTVIPRSVKISEAPGFGQTVLVYDPGSRGALSYLDAAQEVALNPHYLVGEVSR